ncbi:helix-turn-helix domain-containing protein [Cohnella silvisoli]|uniref:Helix-turn-helix transcriptional regulator n=1 Tax=Cohnella silvisoli TaxID=2873699 RepID=A0ABV1KQ86_9BACL|nr:helix-turn-helix transcriptional regulator [Cohnella silvisoli]MCD9022093.1 LuxR family transcriptional regulator [Cohnella silvisoli]
MVHEIETDGMMSGFDIREEQFLVGRKGQLERFNRYLTGESDSEHSIWNIYGTAGVGKSFLLDSFRRKARLAGVPMLHLDSRDFNHKGELLCRQLLRQLLPQQEEGNSDEQLLPLEACLAQLKRLAQTTRVVLAFDTYEEMGELDGWLRERLFKRLPDNVLLILAGRYMLSDQWILSPALRERILYIPLGNLTDGECEAYLRRSGIIDDRQIAQIQLKTGGHPLALSLAASMPLRVEWTDQPTEDTSWFDLLVKAWLREVPDDRLRRMVEAAAVLLHVNREVLAFVMEADVNDESFDALISLSFVRKTRRGWMLHDLMRLAARKQLEERTPEYLHRLMGRSAYYYADLLRRISGSRSTEWEVGELFYYTTGNSMVRALIQSSSRGQYAWEALTMTNIREGEAYLRRRGEAATALLLSGSNSETDQRYHEFVAMEDMKLTIKDFDLHSLVELDRQSVMLLRSGSGEAVGLASIIPIHSATLPYLMTDPFSSPYLSSLPPEDLKLLAVEPSGQSGWFIRTIDYVDWQNVDLIIESMYLIFSYLCSGGLFIASPPPMEFFKSAHLNMGFKIAPGIFHLHYDGRTPTPTFVLDTRGEKLEQFLRFLLKQGGYSDPRPRLPDGMLERLTEREREVALLALEGLTNGEIANALYISVVTVKKHMGSIFGKLAVKNRNHLIKLLVGKS